MVINGLDEIEISVNDVIDDSFAYYSGKNYAGKKLRAIRECANLNQEGLTVTASAVMTPHVISKLDEIALALYEAGVSQLRLREIAPADPTGRQDIDDSMYPSGRELAESLCRFAMSEKKISIFGYLFEVIKRRAIFRRCLGIENFFISVDQSCTVYWMPGLTIIKLGRYVKGRMPELIEELNHRLDTYPIPNRCEGCTVRYVCLESPYVDIDIYNVISSYIERKPEMNSEIAVRTNRST